MSSTNQCRSIENIIVERHSIKMVFFSTFIALKWNFTNRQVAVIFSHFDVYLENLIGGKGV